MSSFEFKSLSYEDIEKLLERLSNLSDSVHVLCFVKNIYNDIKKKGKLGGKILAPGGDFSHSTCFVCFDYGVGIVVGTYYSESTEGYQRIKNALMSTHMFEDYNYLSLTAVPDKIYKSVGTEWAEKFDFKLDLLEECYVYSISPEQAYQFDFKIADDVEVKSLREEDARLVSSYWPYTDWPRGGDEALELIKHTIKHSPTVGLYRKSDGTLLSWVLKWFYGGLGLLQTVDGAKRRGYAQIVVSEMSKCLAREGWHSHALVYVDNYQSNSFFQKMGFQKQFLCYFLDFVKK